MTDFTRPNGGVDFALYEPLTSTDMNEVAANSVLAWESEALRLTSYKIKGEELLGTGQFARLGPASYDASAQCGFCVSAPEAVDGSMIAVSVGAGSIGTSFFYASKPAHMSGQTRPYLISFPAIRVLVYQDTAGATKTGVASSTAFLTWSELYAAGTALDFDIDGDLLHMLAAPVRFGVANPKALIPGINGGQGGFILLDNSGGTTVTATVQTHAYLTTAVQSVAAKTDGTYAIGVCQNEYSLVHDGTTPTVVAIPISANASHTNQKIAWDERLGVWVLLMNGAGGYTGYLHWQTSADGITWPTGDRRRVYIDNVGTLCDFKVLANGLWVAILGRTSGVAAYQTAYRLAWSSDGGATWHTKGIGAYYNATDTADANGHAKLADVDDQVVISIMNTTANGYDDTILVGGLTNSGTALLSEVE